VVLLLENKGKKLMDHGDMCPPWKGLYNIVCVGSGMYNLAAYEYMREQRKGRV